MSLCVRMDEWMLGPPVLMGDRVAWVGAEEPVLATVRWLGRLPDTYPGEMVAGISLVTPCSCRVANLSILQCTIVHNLFCLLTS